MNENYAFCVVNSSPPYFPHFFIWALWTAPHLHMEKARLTAYHHSTSAVPPEPSRFSHISGLHRADTHAVTLRLKLQFGVSPVCPSLSLWRAALCAPDVCPCHRAHRNNFLRFAFMHFAHIPFYLTRPTIPGILWFRMCVCVCLMLVVYAPYLWVAPGRDAFQST